MLTRKEKLLNRLKARVSHDGKPRPGYAECVAQIRAELAMYEENSREARDGGSDAR